MVKLSDYQSDSQFKKEVINYQILLHQLWKDLKNEDKITHFSRLLNTATKYESTATVARP